MFYTILESGDKINPIGDKLSHHYLGANFANASTPQKYMFLGSTCTRQNGRFWKYARLARLTDIDRTVLQGLARLADIR
jgi:hypothetical protein